MIAKIRVSARDMPISPFRLDFLAGAHSEFDDDRSLARSDVPVHGAVHVRVREFAELLRLGRPTALARFVARGRGAIGGLAGLGIEDGHVADELGARNQGRKEEEHDNLPSEKEISSFGSDGEALAAAAGAL